jgi:prepilin-type N-terminal cleavage/methylation domain-containing protein
MISLKNKQSGFTIVELLIVIVVIGILAGLVITTFSGIQQKARDTTRETDIKALHGQLEAFWAQKGYYPSLTDMNTASFVSTNLKGLDLAAFKDPKGASGTLVASPVANSFAYAVTNTGGTSCEADDTTCSKYVLTATLEGTLNGSGTFVKNSLNS